MQDKKGLKMKTALSLILALLTLITWLVTIRTDVNASQSDIARLESIYYDTSKEIREINSKLGEIKGEVKQLSKRIDLREK